MKNARKFRRQFDSQYKGNPYQNEPGESMTVPDMNLTIRQLMVNHTRGVGIDAIERKPEYYGDLEMPQVHDLTDIVKNREYLTERENEIKAQIKAEREAKKPKPTPKPQEVVIVEKKTQYEPEKPDSKTK